VYPQQALEDAECRRRYSYNLIELQRAVSVGALQAYQHKFSDNPNEYVCSFEDFLVWSKTNRPELYVEYLALKANDAPGSHENKQAKQPTDICSGPII
jgi:hypothetical protein